ncbi:MAG: 50S ribosomal protein L13, partial [Flavobacteriales bacterium]
DATCQKVGRMASKIAKILRGKHKPSFTPHVDCGDNVIVINAEKVEFTGKKWTDKIYKHYTGYAGGLNEIPAYELHNKKPIKVIEKAVKNMLPKNRLSRKIFNNLYVYEGAEHDKEAQKPEKLDLNTIR